MSSAEEAIVRLQIHAINLGRQIAELKAFASRIEREWWSEMARHRAKEVQEEFKRLMEPPK